MNLVKGVFGIQDAPAAPDYTGAATATAAGNLAAAQQANTLTATSITSNPIK